MNVESEILPPLMPENAVDRPGSQPKPAADLRKAPVESPQPPAPAPISPMTWILIAWLAGAAGMMLFTAFAFLSLRRLERDASPLRDPEWNDLLAACMTELRIGCVVTLLTSRNRAMPMTWGFRRARLLLPADAGQWPAEKRRAVLLHELAHIKRRDCLTLLITRLACALHWFNPLVWVAWKKMQNERERACDDRVLRSGTTASAYAEQLLQIASSLSVDRLSAAAIAMARPSNLENRLLAILDGTRNRREMSRGNVLTLSTLAAILAMVVAISRPAIPVSVAGAATTRPSESAATGQQVEQVRPIAQTQPAQTYSFRTPDYSLLDEPLRIKPRTLGQPAPSPADAIVMEWPIRWWSSHWSSQENTAAAAMVMHEGHPQFNVMEPNKRKVWVKYFDMFIDPQRYPILVMTYRARNLNADSGSYTIYLDDGSGPDYGGLMPIVNTDLVSDGNTHTISVDLRTMNPIGNIIGMALGIKSAAQLDSPAQLDLLDLRFESVEAQQVDDDAQTVTVRVVDEAGRPLGGAAVTLNAERRNWQRHAITDPDGTALSPRGLSDSGRHMIRIEAEGKLPVEVRDLPAGNEPIEVTLVDAAPYQGIVIAKDGQPLANAIVRITARPATDLHGLWTRVDTEAITDERGHWISAPMAKTPNAVGIDLSHADYTSVPTYQPSVSDLLTGEATLNIEPQELEVRLLIKDEQGQPITQEVAADHSGSRRHSTTRNGLLVLSVLDSAPRKILVSSSGYVPHVVPLPEPDQPAGPMVVSLKRGDEVSVRFVNEKNEPVVGAQVSLAAWDGIPLHRNFVSVETTDADGRVFFRASGNSGVTLLIRNGSFRSHFGINLRDPNPTITLPDPPAPPPANHNNDGRRQGYDPEQIFRQISRGNPIAEPIRG